MSRPAFGLVLALLLAAGRPEPAAANGESAAPSPRTARTGQVAVYRGQSANVPAAVPVYRGSAIQPARIPTGPAPVTAQAEGGRRLWLIDRERDTLTACRLVSTFTVGVDAIRCTRRSLPAN
jgi:hypothetical protein